MSPVLERLFDLLQERGVTAKQVTDHLGLSNSAFTDWKKGKGNPSVDALSKLSEYFDVSLDWLILGKENAAEKEDGSSYHFLDISNALDAELLRKFHALPAEHQGKVMSYIDGMLAVIQEETVDQQKSFA